MFKSVDRSFIELTSLGPFKLLGSSLWLGVCFPLGRRHYCLEDPCLTPQGVQSFALVRMLWGLGKMPSAI